MGGFMGTKGMDDVRLAAGGPDQEAQDRADGRDDGGYGSKRSERAGESGNIKAGSSSVATRIRCDTD